MSRDRKPRAELLSIVYVRASMGHVWRQVAGRHATYRGVFDMPHVRPVSQRQRSAMDLVRWLGVFFGIDWLAAAQARSAV